MSDLPWREIAGEGIKIRFSSNYSQLWEYNIPAISKTWYGPFQTEELAKRAAIIYLLQQAHINFSVSNEAITLDLDQKSDNPRDYLKELHSQLFKLDEMRAALGLEY